jgi:hypothetical protein
VVRAYTSAMARRLFLLVLTLGILAGCAGPWGYPPYHAGMGCQPVWQYGSRYGWSGGTVCR